MNLIAKIIFIVFFIFLNKNIHSQTGDYAFIESRLIIQSIDKNGKPFIANTEFAFMTLNSSNGDFKLKADLSLLKTGNAKLDSTLRKIGPQILIFKGNINENLFRFNQQINDENDYNMQGTLTLNTNTLPCVALYDPLNFAEKSEIRNYRMDFKLPLDASKITILGLENNINDEIVFEIISGQLNTTTQ